MLGIRPQYNGLLIDPCVKKDWDGFTVERRWRNKQLHIEVKNPQHVNKGIEYIEVDGKRIDSTVIPADSLTNGSKIVAYMGKNALPVTNERL